MCERLELLSLAGPCGPVALPSLLSLIQIWSAGHRICRRGQGKEKKGARLATEKRCRKRGTHHFVKVFCWTEIHLCCSSKVILAGFWSARSYSRQQTTLGRHAAPVLLLSLPPGGSIDSKEGKLRQAADGREVGQEGRRRNCRANDAAPHWRLRSGREPGLPRPGGGAEGPEAGMGEVGGRQTIRRQSWKADREERTSLGVCRIPRSGSGAGRQKKVKPGAGPLTMAEGKGQQGE